MIFIKPERFSNDAPVNSPWLQRRGLQNFHGTRRGRCMDGVVGIA